MRRTPRFVLSSAMLAWSALSAIACSPRPVTEVVVVVHTTYAVPVELDGVRITAARPGSPTSVSMGSWSDASQPRMLGLVHEGGALGPIDVSVVGLLGPTELVERRSSFAFVEGEVRRLDLWLVPECANGVTPCRGSETCDPGAVCRTAEVGPSELVPWPGGPSSFDAAVGPDTSESPDAGEPTDAPDDTGGPAPDTNSVRPDATTCCPATAPAVLELTCDGGICLIVTCDATHLHCDTNVNNGCETRIDSMGNCGECGRRCTGGELCSAVGGRLRLPLNARACSVLSSVSHIGRRGRASLVHNRAMVEASTDPILRALRERGLRYPGAHLKSPWPGHLDLAVKDKTFAYLSLEGEPLGVGVKLPDSSSVALLLPFCQPTPYGLGKSGWVSAKFTDPSQIDVAMLEAWIDESYRAQAPKKLVKELDSTNPFATVPPSRSPASKKNTKKVAKKTAKKVATKTATKKKAATKR